MCIRDSVVTPCYRNGCHNQHHDSGYLDAAAGGTGRGANKHQTDGKNLTDLVHRGDVNAVETSGAGGDRLKEGGIQLLPDREIAHRGRVMPLQRGKTQSADEKQAGGGEENHPAVQPEFFAFMVMQQIKQYHESQTADDDERRNNQKHIAAVITVSYTHLDVYKRQTWGRERSFPV